MEETNLRYDEVWQWTRRYCEIYDRVKSASGFVTDVVEHCCTAGQIKRVMQDEILTFLPTYIRSSFNDAERQSRWPSSLPSDCWDDLKTLADTLALGSLSPKDLQGTQVSARKLS